MSACRRCRKRIRQGNVCQACARQTSALAGRKAIVRVERNGACIEVHGVEASEAGLVLADLLSCFRSLTRRYDELTPDLQPVPGGSPVDGDASDFGARRVGFVK